MIAMEQFMEVVGTLSGDEVVELWNEFCDDEDRIISDKEFNSGMATFYSGEPILSILQDFAGESFDPWANLTIPSRYGIMESERRKRWHRQVKRYAGSGTRGT